MLEIYKETKVDARPTAPGSIIQISVPSPDVNERQTKISILPSTAFHEHATRDEEGFAKRYLATQSSVYFRQRKTYPRSFLWRVVDDNRFLEIRSVDLTKSANEVHEAHLTLRLEFQDQIIPHGVALADPEDHEVLNVFIITSTRHLHTFTLRPEFFRRAASIDENVADWCKICRPAPLAFAHPHRLHASGPLELFISLDSGALLRLRRKAGDDGIGYVRHFCGTLADVLAYNRVTLVPDYLR
jgi:nuclear pore complex protein Nup160